jgi:hypothetical protein
LSARCSRKQAAVHRQIESDLGWAEVHRRGERVVDDRDEPVRPRELDDAFEVRDLHERVGERLDVDRLRLGPQLPPPGFPVLAIDQGMGDPVGGKILGDQAVRAAVQAILSEHVIARAKNREQDPRDGRHSAGRHERGLGVLQRRELRVQGQVVGAVAQTRVPDVVVVGLAPVVVRAALEDGHRHRPTDAGPRLARMYRLRVYRPVAVRHLSRSLVRARAAAARIELARIIVSPPGNAGARSGDTEY